MSCISCNEVLQIERDADPVFLLLVVEVYDISLNCVEPFFRNLSLLIHEDAIENTRKIKWSTCLKKANISFER